MRRTTVTGLLIAAVVVAVAAAPASAAGRQPITITATTTFDEIPDDFDATGLVGCDAGIVENGPAHAQFVPWGGIFAGFKVFDCEGSDTGFVLRLNARFDADGSVGTWAVVDAWGSLAGMHGAGDLTGDPITNGIIDNYEGTVTFT